MPKLALTDNECQRGPCADYGADVDLETFRWLLTDDGQALLAAATSAEGTSLQVQKTLRTRAEPDQVAAALSQVELRAHAAAKLGDDAARMYFTRDGLEQATRASVARHRASRVALVGPSVVDLTCGIGGDLVAFARAGLTAAGLDLDPLRVEIARANLAALGLGGAVAVGDGTQLDVSPFATAYADPARRSARGRTFRADDWTPPWTFVETLLTGRACVKVAPGIPHEAVPADAEAEWISDGGDVKEAVLWFGTTPGAVRATLLPGPRTLLGRGLPDPRVRPVGRYLYEPDGAVIRAHLVAEVAEDLDAGLIDPTIAYVTSDALLPTPYATAYEITDQLPFNVKKLKALLREREVGTLTVKKRGSAVEPEELRKKVKPAGPNSATVFLTRVAGAPTMLVGHPA